MALNKKMGQTVWQSKEFTGPAHYSSLIRFLVFSSELTSSAQIAHTATFAWGAEPAGRADCFGISVFAPGHRSN